MKSAVYSAQVMGDQDQRLIPAYFAQLPGSHLTTFYTA